MSKVHSVILSDTNPTAKPGVSVAHTIAAGNLKCIELNTFNEGWVAYLSVKQTGGSNVAFTVDLYDSTLPHPVGEAAVATAAAVDAVSIYEVIPTQSVTSGNALRFRGGHEYAFIQSDNFAGTVQSSRKLYLVIKPTASGDTTSWDVKFVAVNEM